MIKILLCALFLIPINVNATEWNMEQSKGQIRYNKVMKLVQKYGLDDVGIATERRISKTLPQRHQDNTVKFVKYYPERKTMLLVNMLSDEFITIIKKNTMRKIFMYFVDNSICTNPVNRALIDAGMTHYFEYEDHMGNLFISFSIDKTSCNKLDNNDDLVT